MNDDRGRPGGVAGPAVLASTRWRRLIPLAFATYSLVHTLHISLDEAGLLGGLFFLGYFIFQVPVAGFAERRSVRANFALIPELLPVNVAGPAMAPGR